MSTQSGLTSALVSAIQDLGMLSARIAYNADLGVTVYDLETNQEVDVSAKPKTAETIRDSVVNLVRIVHGDWWKSDDFGELHVNGKGEVLMNHTELSRVEKNKTTALWLPRELDKDRDRKNLTEELAHAFLKLLLEVGTEQFLIKWQGVEGSLEAPEVLRYDLTEYVEVPISRIYYALLGFTRAVSLHVLGAWEEDKGRSISLHVSAAGFVLRVGPFNAGLAMDAVMIYATPYPWREDNSQRIPSVVCSCVDWEMRVSELETSTGRTFAWGVCIHNPISANGTLIARGQAKKQHEAKGAAARALHEYLLRIIKYARL